MITQKMLELHKKWLDSYGEDGERLVVPRGANLRGADLSDANLSGANLRGADLSDANLSGADLSGADLRDADLRGADLRGADLRGADLSRANLSGANLRGADLSDANLSGADLSGANLRGANLRDANLSGADLSGANLRGANLRGADLSGANLSGADLRDANLSRADLRGANIYRVGMGGGASGNITPAVFGLSAIDETLPYRVAVAALATDGALEMCDWHTCETAHCLAGWAIHLSGPAGYALEKTTSPSVAGAMLMPSAAHLFYASNDAAREWLQEQLDKSRTGVEHD